MGDVEMQDFRTSVQDRVLSVVRSILEENANTVDVGPEARLVDIGLQPEIKPENFQSVKTLELMILNQVGPQA